MESRGVQGGSAPRSPAGPIFFFGDQFLRILQRPDAKKLASFFRNRKSIFNKLKMNYAKSDADFLLVFGLRGRSSYNTANNTGKNDRKTRASLGILSQGMHCASHTPRRNVFSGANAYSRSLPMIIQCQVRFSHRSTDPFPRPLQILAPVGPEIVPSLAKKSVRVEQ